MTINAEKPYGKVADPRHSPVKRRFSPPYLF
jgi:hypothetical protein